MSDNKILLKMNNITKRFGKVTALKDVNLEVKQGEVHALVGENGAGKSTLMNVLSGVYPYGTYEGDIIYDDETCKFNTIHDSEDKGIVIIHQELALVPYLSIAENMFLGNERTMAMSKNVIDWPRTYQRAKELLELVGLDEDPHTLIKDIGVGKQQLVEIAKAISKNCRLLILDEPTASLNETDSQKLLELISKFRDQGMTSIIISHKLNEISYIANSITVIRDGSTIETLDNTDHNISEDRIIAGMVGRALTDRFPKRSAEHKISDEVLLEVDNWNVYHPLNPNRKVNDNVSIKIHRGEVVGFAGLMGAGRTEFAKSLFGHSYGVKISGQVKLRGKEVHLNNVEQAIKEGLAYVTEDRKGDGLVLENPIATNMTLANLNEVSEHQIIDKDLELKTAKELKQDLNVKCASVLQNVGNLSGGNQQKVLLAKWIFAHPDVLILDEPTRGIDVGAKYEIYCLINKLVEAGKAVLMISSELPEVLGMSDRIYVMNEGKIVAEMPRKDASQESIMGAILRTSGKKITSEQ
ncbi:MAG: multiple monosaccharide ABC transporter ATP-binding protein [Succinivibrio sp.]|nr:sugar ABC transporter ATP-binding protein [Succinivibrio sp.]MCI5637827.1 sugar ABC transporter ATP-binding protein [Succinivibrio sp.]MCI6449317.1 sugar ABC transporter ATP-binding protein [Succinivibrio sp.]MCI7773705.1 sugar ABC transporter ATP-binding protein [Succinivibrio sp.]MCI7785599.1 sugar ABC transporter ATP-binding protein [Succinivibrio sp.]